MPVFYNVQVHALAARAAPLRMQPWPPSSRVRGPVVRPAGFDPQEFRFVLLPMDLTYLGAGEARRSYAEQLEELRELKAAYPDVVYPLVAADPRRPGLLDVVRRSIEDHGFTGVKLDPSLGFWPSDPRLDPVYRYCVENEVPVLAHCSRGDLYYRGDLEPLRVHPRSGRYVPGTCRSEIIDALADPANYRWILEEHPELRLCLTHHAGEEAAPRSRVESGPMPDPDAWVRTVTDLLRNPETPNVYADLGHAAAAAEYHPLIKVLADDGALGRRILFSADFYRVQRTVPERRFGMALRAFVGEETWRRIASDNAERWLGPPRRAEVEIEVDGGAVAAGGAA